MAGQHVLDRHCPDLNYRELEAHPTIATISGATVSFKGRRR